MNASFQTIIALALVACAAIGLLYRWWRNRKKSGCGGGCACPSQQIKIQHGRKEVN